MKFARNVSFSSSQVEIEEVQITPEVIEELIEEPEVDIFELTQEEIDLKEEESRLRGFEEGSEKATETLQVGISETVEKLSLLISNFEQSEHQFFNSMEDYIFKIASKISQNIIQSELKQDPTLIVEMVNTSLNKLKESRKITIFSSDDDFFLLEEVDFHKKLNLSSEVNITLLAKKDLMNGSFYIESDLGNNLYSLIEDQIIEIEQQL